MSFHQLFLLYNRYSVDPDYSNPAKSTNFFLSLESLSYRGSTSWFSHHYFLFILACFHDVMWSCIKSGQLNYHQSWIQTLVARIGIIVTLRVESSESEAFQKGTSGWANQDTEKSTKGNKGHQPHKWQNFFGTAISRLHLKRSYCVTSCNNWIGWN